MCHFALRALPSTHLAIFDLVVVGCVHLQSPKNPNIPLAFATSHLRHQNNFNAQNTSISIIMLSYTSKMLLSSTARRSAVQLCATRGLASAPAEKLRCIFEEYRKTNFSRETPTRFKKELVKSVAPSPSTTEIDIEGINMLLRNIGHESDCLSRQEQDTLLDEAVGHHDTRSIPVDKVMQLI